MPNSYADLEVRILPGDERSFRVDLTLNHEQQLGTGSLAADALPWISGADPMEEGQRLFHWLLADAKLKEAWIEARGISTKRRVRLRIDADVPELDAIPWELLPDAGEFVAAVDATPFSRYLDDPRKPPPPIAERPIRILVAIANPKNLQDEYDLARIDVAGEWRSLQDACAGLNAELALLPEPCTLGDLEAELRRGYHVLHVIAHGGVSERSGGAALYLAGEDNQVVPIPDQEIAAMLGRQLQSQDSPLRLAFLASCHSAAAPQAVAYRSLAGRLVKAGLPAVVAMQDAVSMETARAFTETFYAELLRHGLVDLAGNQARSALLSGRFAGSHIPVVIMRLRDGRLLQVRTQEELDYLDRVIAEFHEVEELYTPLAGAAEVEEVPDTRQAKPSKFRPASFWRLDELGFGPAREVKRVPVDDLRQVVREHQRLVVLGEPGSGKTTTLWQLAYEYALEARSDPNAALPLLVPLREFGITQSAEAFVGTHFDSLGDRLPEYLRTGRVLLMLDGLNEMPERTKRVQDIQRLLDQYQAAPVVVSCRTLDYVGKLELKRLEKLEIQELDPPRQRAYVERYLGHDEGEALFWQLAGDEIAELWQVWEQAGGAWELFWTAERMPNAVARQLDWNQRRHWDRFRREELPPLLALGSNPFMLRLMVDIYEREGGELPANRGKLIGAFVDVLLEEQQTKMAQEAVQWPGAEAIADALTGLAYGMQEMGQGITAVEKDRAKTLLTDGVDPDQLLYLAASAGLLDRPDASVSFAHQLVQEYFAALILKDRFEVGEDLSRYWPDGWLQPSGWEETFILLAGILDDMSGLVQELVPRHPALAARCIAESGGERPDDAVIELVQQRLVSLATGQEVPLQERNAAGDALNHVGDPRPGVGLTADGLPDIEWCPIPAGEFRMGTRPEDIPGLLGRYGGLEAWYRRETPERTIRLETYWIGKYPITNAQYDAFVQDGGYTDRWRNCWTDEGWRWKEDQTGPRRYGDAFDLPNHPVVGVTWYEAYAFCRWLSQKLGQEISLPTEAQWEKAARGGDGRQYPWGDEITSDHANYYETGIGTTSTVGIFPKGASPYAVLDMSGNARDWCLTKWRNDYTEEPDDDPQGDVLRVVRGGSWLYEDLLARCAVRSRFDPYDVFRSQGVRVVCARLLS